MEDEVLCQGPGLRIRGYDLVGLAMLTSAYRPGVPGVWELVLTIGLTLAGVLALYLVWSIFRSGHH